MKKMTYLFLVFSCLAILSCGSDSDCKTKHCDDFRTQKEAQETYDSNRKCYKSLDSDGDGVACESLSD
ncbi:MAG: excalibur calcium-binding domain-containing protein [Microscillaceae bacterium]|nr:excalibur calcium-binding domain-containing protein [Microscillaceae bacterium]